MGCPSASCGSLARPCDPASALTLTLVHTYATDPAEVTINLRGGSALEVRRTVFSERELNAHSTVEQPDTVVSRSMAKDFAGRGSVAVCRRAR